MEQWIRGVGCDPCLIPFLQVQRGEEAQPGSCTGSDVHAVACQVFQLLGLQVGDGATCEMVPKKSCGRKRSACKDLFGRGVSSQAGALESFETASFPRLQGPTLRV